MARTPASSRWRWLRIGIPCGACLALGIACGASWPGGGAEPIWRDGGDPGTGARSIAAAPPTFADIVDAARPGIVTVRARVPASLAAPAAAGIEDAERRNGGPRIEDALDPIFDTQPGYRNGSGFIVNAKGLVVTSRHVIAGADAIEVLVPRHGTFLGLVVGEDEATDLAILRLQDAPAELPTLPLGASESLRAGDWIVTVGNPYGFAQTVTAGVVSFVGRHLPHSDLLVTNDFVQISAPVNPGSSGCPVLDMHGLVVGVTTQAAAQAQGISFAVPSRTLKWTLDAMSRSEDGRVRRGYLGIEFSNYTVADAEGNPGSGAYIVRVIDGAPAHRAGIRRGDVIIGVDGQAIADATVLHEHIVRGQPGAHIALQVLRDGRPHDPIEAVLSEMGRAKAASHLN